MKVQFLRFFYWLHILSYIITAHLESFSHKRNMPVFVSPEKLVQFMSKNSPLKIQKLGYIYLTYPQRQKIGLLSRAILFPMKLQVHTPVKSTIFIIATLRLCVYNSPITSKYIFHTRNPRSSNSCNLIV